jgi:hypothetical protein
VILEELGDRCHVSTSQDLKRILARVEEEGKSFLMITLPTYGKSLERALDRGYVDRDLFQGFNWRGGLPVFLSGFLDQIFDRGTGRLLHEPNVDAIQAIRQLTLMFAKIEIPVSRKRERAAYKQFMECEQYVLDHGRGISAERRAVFRNMSRLIFRDTFSRAENQISAWELVPRHGNGSTADRLIGNDKWADQTWTIRLESVVPSWYYRNTSIRSFSFGRINPESIDYDPRAHLEPGSEVPSRVTAVPKDARSPRLIAMEPAHMQYAQQALLGFFKEDFQKDIFSRKFVDFSSQVPNQLLAKEGSLSGNLATLDLSEASDRVSNLLVMDLVEGFPHLGDYLQATRSTNADVPGYGIIPLSKYASMGSGLCFPVEAMVFCTVVFIGIQNYLNRQLTRKDLRSFFGQVRVYGDDIIVPVEYTLSVVEALEAYGFKVNSSKSFWTGKFRESCGKDYYQGEDVSIVRLRQLIPTQRQQTKELEALVSFRNRLYYEYGFFKTAKYLDAIIERLIPFPAGLPGSSGLVKHSFTGYDTHRWDDHLQHPLVKAAVAVPRPSRSKLDGEGALLKFFITHLRESTGLPVSGEDHLEFAGRPSVVDIKLKYVRPF